MKKRLFLMLSVLSTVGLTLGLTPWHSASATVPGVNSLINKDSSGNYGNAGTDYGYGGGSVFLSGDGRYVAFDSQASNLVSGDTNGKSDVFVKDTSNGSVVRASVASGGSQIGVDSMVRGITYDGRYVLFTVGFNGSLSVRDLVNNTTVPVCNSAYGCVVSGGMQTGGAISADGRYVTWGDKSGGIAAQVKVTDMVTHVTKTVSVDSAGNNGNSSSYVGGISCDGGIISFSTQSTNIGSGAGTYIASFDYSGNINLTRISLDQGSATQVSCNGNVVLIGSYSSSSSYIKTYNRLTGVTAAIATGVVGQGISSGSISDDGRFIAIATQLNLDPSHPSTGMKSMYDMYVKDTKNGTTQLVSFTVAGNKSGSVYLGGISADGSYVAYGYDTPASSDTSHELISGVTTGTTSTQTDTYTSKTGF